MVEEKVEETIENPEEGKTPEEKTPDSEQETEEKKPEVAEKIVTQKELDKVYARMKLAEEKAKKAEAKLAEAPPATSQSVSDVDAIVEVQQATKGLSPDEIAELKLRANVNSVSLSEARKDENFVLWQKAYKEKVELEEQQLPPSTKPGISKRMKPVAEIGASKEDIKAKDKFLKEAGWGR